MWVYNKELCLQDSIWRQERTKHNYQYRHIGVLLACLHLVWRCCVARRKERIHSCSPCCLTEIFLALESASSLFAAIPPGFGSTASLSGIPLTHCSGPAPHVYTWQHVSLLCWMGSCCCCLSKRRGRAGAVGQEFSPATTHKLSQVDQRYYGANTQRLMKYHKLGCLADSGQLSGCSTNRLQMI